VVLSGDRLLHLLDLKALELTAVRQAVKTRDWAAEKSAWSQDLMTRTPPR
jgi:hypothetical protein